MRNKEKMLEVLVETRREVERDIKYKINEIQTLTEKITKVELKDAQKQSPRNFSKTIQLEYEIEGLNGIMEYERNK